MKEKHNRGCVYALKYDFIWCVKYGKEILSPEIKHTLDESFNQIAYDNNFEILQVNYGSNYVHLNISCNPNHSIPNMIKALKGASAKYVFKYHNEIKEEIGDNSLWHPSYYVTTNATEESVSRYIEKTINKQIKMGAVNDGDNI